MRYALLLMVVIATAVNLLLVDILLRYPPVQLVRQDLIEFHNVIPNVYRFQPLARTADQWGPHTRPVPVL